MKKLAALVPCLGCVLAATPSHAIDLKQSKLTQVVNDVQIISAADQNQKPAIVNELLSMPDILRTGAASRAELLADDQTVTRVGANTIFSFDPANRSLDLKQGSLLFHAPHGKGGGTIQTGAATASVLGTTLIVVTTPDGGFKVLDLEGQVLVKLPNGKHLKLEPGQMTFILPGSKSLSPVVVFRLDELVENSLLVGGFTTTLDSFPLIQQEIARQDQLIHSGRLNNTGWYVGDNATPSQVAVLDINTVALQTGTQGANFSAAANADALINQPSLTDASIPTPPNHVFTSLLGLTGVNFSDSYQSAGFVARNICFQAQRDSDSSSLMVNLRPYTGSGNFAFIALRDMYVDCSLSFCGLSSRDNFEMLAGGKLDLQSGVSLTANVNNFLLASGDSMCLDDNSIYNYANNLVLSSGGNLTIKDYSTLYACQNLTLIAGGNINISDSTLDACPYSGLLSLISASGSITVQNTTVTGTTFLLRAATDINVTGEYTPQPIDYVKTDADGFVRANEATSGSYTGTFFAGNQITVNNFDFTTFSYLNMAAKTIILSYDGFSSSGTYVFATTTGKWAINAQNNGGVSFWYCTLDNQPLQSSDIQTGTVTGPGIYSNPINGVNNQVKSPSSFISAADTVKFASVSHAYGPGLGH